MSSPARSRATPRLRDSQRRWPLTRHWAASRNTSNIPSPTLDEVGRLALRRRMVATVVIAVVAFFPLDLIAHSEQTWSLTAARALLLGTYVPVWWLMPRVSEAVGTRLLGLLVILTSPAIALLCVGTGYRDSPAFSFVWSWPLFAGLMFLEQPRLALFSGGPSMLSGAAVLALDPRLTRKPEVIAYYAMVTAISTMVAAVATSLYHRVHLRELRIREERTEALRRLADAERERDRLERLAAIGGLAGGVAHEVNNPLGYVKSNLDWMARQLGDGALLQDPAEVRSVLDESLQGVTRIERIIAGLGALAVETPDEPSDVAVPEAIRVALSMVAEPLRGARIEVDAPPSLPRARASPGRLAEVLQQLLLNAADALQDRPPEQRWLRVSARAAGDRMELEVLDGGPGLPLHVLRRLFQPFITTKSSVAHVGLGLPIAFEQVRRQGGTLEGGNSPGAGACFRVSLPLAAPRG
jgi:two-component system, NtrC family, sensor kinase